MTAEMKPGELRTFSHQIFICVSDTAHSAAVAIALVLLADLQSKSVHFETRISKTSSKLLEGYADDR